MTGAARRNPTAAESGTPREIEPRATGTVPHSQSGAAAPTATPESRPRTPLRGTKRASCSVETATSRMLDTRTPNSRYGPASRKMPRNTVTRLGRRERRSSVLLSPCQTGALTPYLEDRPAEEHDRSEEDDCAGNGHREPALPVDDDLIRRDVIGDLALGLELDIAGRPLLEGVDHRRERLVHRVLFGDVGRVRILEGIGQDKAVTRVGRDTHEAFDRRGDVGQAGRRVGGTGLDAGAGEHQRDVLRSPVGAAVPAQHLR